MDDENSNPIMHCLNIRHKFLSINWNACVFSVGLIWSIVYCYMLWVSEKVSLKLYSNLPSAHYTIWHSSTFKKCSIIFQIFFKKKTKIHIVKNLPKSFIYMERITKNNDKVNIQIMKNLMLVNDRFKNLLRIGNFNFVITLQENLGNSYYSHILNFQLDSTINT